MPAAAGAVAAAAIADQMLGPKEDRQVAIVLVLSGLTSQSEFSINNHLLPLFLILVMETVQ